MFQRVLFPQPGIIQRDEDRVICLQMCAINTDTLPTEKKGFILNVCSNSTRQFEINKLCRVVRASAVEKRLA